MRVLLLLVVVVFLAVPAATARAVVRIPIGFFDVSGLEQSSGKKKPAYAAFASTAAGIVGQSQMIAPGHVFKITLAVPFIAWHDPAGTTLDLTYVLKKGNSTVAIGRPPVTLGRDQDVTFNVKYDPAPTRPTRSQSRSWTTTASPSHM